MRQHSTPRPSMLALAVLAGCLQPSERSDLDGVITVRAESLGQTSWHVGARTLDDLDAAIQRIVDTPASELPTLVRVSLSPRAASEVREWVHEFGGDVDLTIDDYFNEVLSERGYVGWIYDDPHVGDTIGRSNAGVFLLDLEEIYWGMQAGAEDAVDWAVWVLWDAGIPAVKLISQGVFLDVPRRLRASAKKTLESDPDWPRYKDLLTPSGD